MPSLIHATITVSGDESQLEACDARIRLLLAEEPVDGEVNEHHGAGALCYDLKVREGIPFPAFARASQEFPALRMIAEWVNVDAGERGAATIVDGKLAAHDIHDLAVAAGGARPLHIAAAGDGRLELALTFFRADRGEWLGYALTAGRDALLRVVRAPQGDGVELYASDGSAEWRLCWRGSIAQSAFDFEVVAEPQPIEAAVYRELEQLARDFTAEWMWFASGAQEEIAIEKERHERAGYAVHAANVKASRLRKMKGETAGPEGGFRSSTLNDDEAWIRDVVQRCWIENFPQ